MNDLILYIWNKICFFIKYKIVYPLGIKIIAFYMHFTHAPCPSRANIKAFFYLLEWYFIGILLFLGIGFVLPYSIRIIIWLLFWFFFILLILLILISPFWLFYLIIYKILSYVHIIVFCFYLRARGKWKFRAHTSFKSEPWDIKLQSRKKNKILLFIILWFLIVYFGSYELYVYASGSYLFFLSKLGYNKLLPVGFSITKPTLEGEAVRQLARKIKREEAAGRKEEIKEIKEWPPRHGYYLFFYMNIKIPLIYRLNAVRFFFTDLFKLLTTLLFLRIMPDVLIVSFTLVDFKLYAKGFEAWDQGICLWIMLLIVQRFFQGTLNWETPQYVLNPEIYDDDFDEDDLDNTPEVLEEYREYQYEEEMADIEDFAQQGAVYMPGQYCWRWFFYGREDIRDILDFPEVALADIDGPSVQDCHDWGWEYYKFLLTNKFCDDCLEMEKPLAFFSDIEKMRFKIDSLVKRHIREPLDPEILYKFEKAIETQKKLAFWEF